MKVNHHVRYCNYEVAKANKIPRRYSQTENKPKGIRTSELSKAMLAQQLLAMF